jgi:hypothetical protein
MFLKFFSYLDGRANLILSEFQEAFDRFVKVELRSRFSATALLRECTILLSVSRMNASQSEIKQAYRRRLLLHSEFNLAMRSRFPVGPCRARSFL